MTVSYESFVHALPWSSHKVIHEIDRRSLELLGDKLLQRVRIQAMPAMVSLGRQRCHRSRGSVTSSRLCPYHVSDLGIRSENLLHRLSQPRELHGGIDLLQELLYDGSIRVRET